MIFTNRTIGDLVVAILQELPTDVSISVDVDESNNKQLYVQVDDDSLIFRLQSFILSMSEYDKLLLDILNHFIPEIPSPLKRFIAITPSSDKPYNIEYMYEGELLANYAETYDIISHEHKHNIELTKFVEEAQPGDVYTIKSKDEFDVITTIMRLNDKYE
jgi:hypothetical protein